MPKVNNTTANLEVYFSGKLRRKKKFDAKHICEQYVVFREFCAENVVEENHAQVFKGEPVDFKIKKYRPYVLGEWLEFLEVTESMWHNWAKDEELAEIVERINKNIKTQKEIGGLTGQFTASLVSQTIGLKTAVEQTNYDGQFLFEF